MKKNPRKMLPVAATLFVTLDKTFWRCICWLQIKLQPLFTASISNAENVQNNKNFKRVNCGYHSLHNNWQPLTNGIATWKGNLIKVNASRACVSETSVFGCVRLMILNGCRLLNVPITDLTSNISASMCLLSSYTISAPNATSEWHLLRLANSFAGFSYHKILVITWLMTLKKAQSASSWSNPFLITMKIFMQQIMCMKILFSMIFELIQKFSNAFDSNISGSIAVFKRNDQILL